MIVIDFKGIVYSATNKVNGKRYIGQTVRDLDRRIGEHISNAKREPKYAFHKSIVNYGEENFIWEVLDEANTIEELDEKEIHWIKYYKTYSNKGYNMSLGGQKSIKEYCDLDELSAMRNGREFLVFDLNGELVDNRVSQTFFADEIGVVVQSVNHVLAGIKNQVKNYVLIYKDEFSDDVLKEKIEKANKGLCKKDFYVFEKDSMSFVGKWNNRQHCQEELGVRRKTITRNLDLNNKGNRGKFLFYYYRDLPNNLKEVI